jgi:hypothetical protein
MHSTMATLQFSKGAYWNYISDITASKLERTLLACEVTVVKKIALSLGRMIKICY